MGVMITLVALESEHMQICLLANDGTILVKNISKDFHGFQENKSAALDWEVAPYRTHHI